MAEENQSGTMKRMAFMRKSLGRLAAVALGAVSVLTARGAKKKNTLWQIDPFKCIKCENCSTHCVIDPSAVK